MPLADHRPRGVHKFQYFQEYFILVYDFHDVSVGILCLNIFFLNPKCIALRGPQNKSLGQSSVNCAF